ncbi:hypothetical protein BGZ88_007014 [Linnemannia elongata]|nr:hypothetical protein BGZ88_007014 [Linnemannia elongata]
MTLRTYSLCQEAKDSSGFYSRKDSYCKDCKKATNREYRRKKAESIGQLEDMVESLLERIAKLELNNPSTKEVKKIVDKRIAKALEKADR